MKAHAIRTFVLLAAAAVLPAGARAQTNDEANASLRFDFSNPGARSLGMGGAFLALADDSTAAYANPAGLINPVRPEVSFEARYTDVSDTFVFGGGQSLAGQPGPTGNGADRVNGLLVSEAEIDGHAGIGFLSFFQPLRKRWGSMGIAAYRHELTNVDQGFQSQGAFFWESPCGGPGEPTCETGLPFARSRHRPVESDTDLEIVNYGVSWATTLGKARKYSLGIGLSYYTFELLSQSNRLTPSNKFGTDTNADGLDEGITFGVDPISSSTTQFGDDSAVAVNLGFLVRPTDKLSFGVTYRQGPEFTTTASTRVLNREKQVFDPTLPPPEFPGDYRSRTYLPGQLPSNIVAQAGKPNPYADINEEIFVADFKVPDVYGAGVAYSPIDPLTISIEYNYIDYAQLADLADLFQVFIDDGSETRPVNAFEVDPAHVYRLGVEYAFKNIQVRVGAWYDPDHEIRYVTGTNQDRRIYFLPGEDEMHYSLGLGWSMMKDRLKFGAAADFSDRVDTLSFFAVVRTDKMN